MAQLVEHIHGKDEVPGSNPGDASKKLSNPIGLLNFLSKPTKEAWNVINAPRALYGIATESRMASRASVHICRLDNIQHFVLIPYSPYGLRTYRLRRISYTTTL